MVAMRNEPTSLIEHGLRSVSRLRGAKKGVFSRLWAGVANLIGTLLALGAFTVGAFLVNLIVGFIVLGVCLLLLDTKVTIERRNANMRRG